jgi:predicted HicB family RNase H-like nuclease
MPATAEPEMRTKPVRVDLSPAVHKELRRAAADQEMSMAALARKVVEEYVARRAKDGAK